MSNNKENQNSIIKERQFIRTNEVNEFIDSLKDKDPIYTQILIGKLVSGDFLVIPDECEEPDYAGYSEWADSIDEDRDFPMPEDLN